MRALTDEPREAIDALYEAFRAYPLKPKIEVCPDCELDSAEAALHRRPLRDLRWKDLGIYPTKAITTFGDERDFKHFLPRILELFVLDYTGGRYDVGSLFRKLEYASWRSWPESEAEAIRRFVGAWRRALAAGPKQDAWQLEELEEALAEAGL